MLPSTKPYFNKEDIPDMLQDIKKVLESGRLILGPYTKRFEEQFANYLGVKHTVAVNSCTTALEISLKYFDVKGRDVILPTNTFVATAVAVLNAGGKPILVDIDQDTLALDIEEAKQKVNSNTAGIIIVHIAGLITPKIGELKEFCKKNNLFLIEDAAHAHGAALNGKKAGSFGDAGCFSFYPTKVLTTATGGMIATDDERLVKFAQSSRHHGQGKSLEDIQNLGNDWVMNEVGAVLGIYQLKRLEKNLKKREEIADIYIKNLENLEGISLFTLPEKSRHSYYKFPVLLDKPVRKKLAEYFKENDIEYGGSIYYPPIHLQPIFRRRFKYKKGMFPKAEDTLDRVFCLPLFPQMTEQEINKVIEIMKKGLEEFN